MSYNLNFNADGSTTGNASGDGNFSGNFGLANRSYLSGGLAALQTPTSAPQLPSWLSSNPDSNLTELLQTYGGVNNAYDPSAQVAARNNAIGNNTSMGTQAANNAATEYANRAAQSGGNALGAGVVKAQSMMPVMASNNKLQTDAADVAAKAHQEAATLSSQIAANIGQLRQGYLSTLTDYATKTANTNLGYATQRAGLYQHAMTTGIQAQNNALEAAKATLKQPFQMNQGNTYTSGAYGTNSNTNPQGARFNQDLGAYQNSALSTLGGMFQQ